MKKLALTAALGAACLGLAACGDRGAENADTGNSAGTEASGEAESAGGADGSSTAANGGGGEGRIVEENGVRYREAPDGTRVRVNADGLDVDIDGPNVDLPDVDVGINDKGNPDVDVRDKKDGNSGPN